jgi:hypothetical protein
MPLLTIMELGHARTSSHRSHWIHSSRVPVLFADHRCHYSFGTYSWFETLFLGPWSQECILTLPIYLSGLFPTSVNDVRTTLAPGTSKTRGFFIETILTAELVFTILMLAKEKHK